jgi:hypothetical protein
VVFDVFYLNKHISSGKCEHKLAFNVSGLILTTMNKELLASFFLSVFAYHSLSLKVPTLHLHQSSKIKSNKEVTRTIEINVFHTLFCLMMEGSGSAQIMTDLDPVGPTNLRIQIHDIAIQCR